MTDNLLYLNESYTNISATVTDKQFQSYLFNNNVSSINHTKPTPKELLQPYLIAIGFSDISALSIATDTTSSSSTERLFEVESNSHEFTENNITYLASRVYIDINKTNMYADISDSIPNGDGISQFGISMSNVNDNTFYIHPNASSFSTNDISSNDNTNMQYTTCMATSASSANSLSSQDTLVSHGWKNQPGNTVYTITNETYGLTNTGLYTIEQSWTHSKLNNYAWYHPGFSFITSPTESNIQMNVCQLSVNKSYTSPIGRPVLYLWYRYGTNKNNYFGRYDAYSILFGQLNYLKSGII